jgi:flavodoxin
MKRKKWPIVLAVILVLLAAGAWYLFGTSKIPNVSTAVTPGEAGTRSLIVYFTRLGEIPDSMDAVSSATTNTNTTAEGSDTEAAAKILQSLTGADMYQLYTKRYYRNSFFGTAATGLIEEVLNLRPSLAALPENLDDYDVIYIGYPVWWMEPPMAVGTFLESYDLTGKTVVPFCTSQDSTIDITMDFIRKAAGNATVLDGYRFHGSTQADAESWLDSIGMLETMTVSTDTVQASVTSSADVLDAITPDTETYRGFTLDNVLQDPEYGDIHYSAYIPENASSCQTYDPVRHTYIQLGETVGNAFSDGAKLK